MKHVMTLLLHTTLVALLLVSLSGGCSKKPVMPPATAGDSGTSAGRDIAYPAAGDGYSEGNLAMEGNLDDTASTNIEHLGGMAIDGSQGEQSDEYKQLHGRSSQGLLPVYFDFDQAAIRPDMAQRIVKNSEYLKQIPDRIVVEGNCDDRGTNEYNLALGEKRAINVRIYLENLGIDPSRIRTVSYGEERPLFFEQNDFAWSQNRRVDFVIE